MKELQEVYHRSSPKDPEADQASANVRQNLNSQMHPFEASKKIVLEWKDLECLVGKAAHPKTILGRVSGHVRQGEVMAIMGVTGAGKTTLLDHLAGRTGSRYSGTLLYNGVPYSMDSLRRILGYVQQHDIHLHTSTVREALDFSEMLRASSKKALSNGRTYVDEVMDLLELRPYEHVIIGLPGEGM